MSLETENSSKMISLVTPIYNEENNIDEFISQIDLVLSQSGYEYEIICVNDGSTDSSAEHIKKRADSSPKVKFIDLSRNFGKEVALSAGLDFATGDAVVIMDADLQHPPQLILTFLQKWREGYDGVFGVRVKRSEESTTKRLLTGIFYKILQKVSEVHIPPNAGDFRLLDRSVVDALVQLPERTRFMKGLYAWVGFRQIGVEYEAHERVAGETKWSMLNLWSLALEGLFSFSSAPLKVWSYLGFIIALMSLVYAFIVTIDAILSGSSLPGIPSILTAVFFIGGVQLMTAGILGEYISRVFVEVKRRPVYIVRNHNGFDMQILLAMKKRRDQANLRSE